MRRTLRLLEVGGDFDIYDTGDPKRRKIIRCLVLLPDYAGEDQYLGDCTYEAMDCVTLGQPGILRARKQLYELFWSDGLGISDTPADQHVESDVDAGAQHIGVYAGRGALEISAQGEGAEIAMLVEKDPVVRMLLRRRFPNAVIIDDLDSENWRGWIRRPGATLGVMTGPPCGPYAPTWKGRFLSDPRAQCLLDIGAVACASETETIDVESLYWIADGDDGRAPKKMDDVMEAAAYRRLVPLEVVDVGRVTAASIGPSVFRNRALLHYEWQDLALSELEELESQPDGDTAAGSLAPHLVSKEETPEELRHVDRTIVRLDEPQHAGAHDARSPIIVGHVAIGDPGSELFVGSIVKVKSLAGDWRVLVLGKAIVTVMS